MKNNQILVFLLVCITLTALVLVLDLILSGNGNFSFVAGGAPYVAVILATLWLPGRSYTVFFAVLSSILSIFGLLFELEVNRGAGWIFTLRSGLWNQGGESSFFAIGVVEMMSRTLAISAVWMTAILTIKRKASEEKSSQLGAIVESSDDAIVGVDMDGIITSWNIGAERTYLYEAHEMIGRPISLLWVEGEVGDMERELLGFVKNGEQIDPYETVRRRKDDSLVDVSIALSPTRNGMEQIAGMSEIGRDITDRKKFEQALIEAKEHAERMSRLKSSFLTNMSHEIRTPLSGILGFASIMAQDKEAKHFELAMLIEKSGRRLLDTINSVLDLSMLESDSFILHPKILNVPEEVEEKVSLLQPLARDKGLSLFVELPEQPAFASLDSACLDRILNNLIGNAIKFTEHGHIKVMVNRKSDYVIIKISDTGIGISESFVERLFDEFEQESSGISRLYEGSGLGLSITRRLVKLMHGTISVESERGKGSMFTVTFPLARDEADARFLRQDRTPALRSMPQRNKLEVLVVDDDPKMRTLIRLLLNRICRVDLADSEQSAIEQASQKRYDMVLLDINLGRVRTGVDALKELRKIPQYDLIPVVALTGYSLPRDREYLLESGFDDYLPKPIKEDLLYNVVNQVLDLSRT